MLTIEKETVQSPAHIAEKLQAFFGMERGMKLVDDSDLCLLFEGGGGYVRANICEEGEKRRVEFTTTEWENAVRVFAREEL